MNGPKDPPPKKGMLITEPGMVTLCFLHIVQFTLNT